MKELQHAIQYLKGKGVIKRDGDIAQKTGYNKSTVSSYIGGRTIPSENFLHKFESVYGIKLDQFKKGSPTDEIPIKDPLRELLEQVLQIKAYSIVNQSLLVEILAEQTGKPVMQYRTIVEQAMEAELKSLMTLLKQH